VVDIIEQFEIFTAHLLAKFHAPGGVIALVILVVHLGVEEFHHEGESEFFRERDEALADAEELRTAGSDLVNDFARLVAEDTATRNALGPRFTLVPPDGGDVKTHEGASAAMQTLALLEADAARAALKEPT
jgi:hypothetical protein